MSEAMLADYLDAAQEAARRAAVVLENWRTRFQVREKAPADLVTDADLASQRTIRDYLSARFPSHRFLGEEDKLPHDRPGPDAPPTWIVDPIDGTTNYVHDCPMYCVSIGLQVAGELVAGVVFDPRHDELFAAARGRGSTLNGRPVAVSRTAVLKQALLATGFPYSMEGRDDLLEWWKHFGRHAQSLRRTGSTALNLAYVACGRFDAFYAFDNHVWDVAGGVVLVREAGGQVTAASGQVHDPYARDCVASNGLIHQAILDVFRRRCGANDNPPSHRS